MTTAGAIVSAAFMKSGVKGIGQVMSNQDNDDALADLGDMLAQWNEKRWLIWNLLDFAFTSTGAASYTVGPGGNFNMTPRPAQIEAAYVRQINNAGLPVDMPLTVIPAREEWSRLALKSLVSFPRYVFLDAASPLANLYIYPLPNASIYEIHLIVKNVWPVTVTSATSFANYPPVAYPAMKFNLARRLRQGFGKGLRPDPELNNLARDALDTMRKANTQIPELNMPKMLVQPARYNILSDQLY